MKGDREEGTFGLRKNALLSAAVSEDWGGDLPDWIFLGTVQESGAFISMSVQMGLEAAIQFYESHWTIWIYCNYSSEHALWLSLSCKCVRGKCAHLAVTVKLAHAFINVEENCMYYFSVWLLWIS